MKNAISIILAFALCFSLAATASAVYSNDYSSTIGCGTYHFIAIKPDGSLWSWGGKSGNKYGQLGDGTYEDRYEPIIVMSDAAYVDAKGLRSLAIKKDGSLWIWGGFNEKLSSPIKVMENVLSASLNGENNNIIALKRDGSLSVLSYSKTGDVYNTSVLLQNVTS